MRKFQQVGKAMVMRVFVAGGTGVLGRRLMPQVVVRGHHVTATATSAAKSAISVAHAGKPDMKHMERPYLAERAGAKRPLRVPKWLARPLAGDVAVLMMTEGRGFSTATAKAELGWQLRYPSRRQGFQADLA